MEIALIIYALSLGFASGFHCIGMCGPIALSLGLTKKQAANFYIQNLTYQFGRIFTYAFLGAVLGIVGEAFHISGFQNYLTIIAGILLILMAIFSFGGKDFASKIPFLSKFLWSVKMNLGKYLQKPDYKSRFFTGILNGFLPCGMVYMALAASLPAGGIWESAVFMVIFGLGTLPFMFVVVVVGNLITQNFRIKILKIIPVLMIVLGGLFILRGLELGIPYISPSAETLKIHTEHEMQNMEDATCH
ncbi:MAG: sulfite exporter TauE/SafE family protein [Flavobacteriaceae bacterium]|jgi:sulfite exporter TauE/SafE|nr:sulfite exporter TauE/SafE family protein [Flavobacteriaceae bacterium]